MQFGAGSFYAEGFTYPRAHSSSEPRRHGAPFEPGGRSHKIENFKIRSKGHRTWTVDEVDAFQAFYPIGTEERLAFDLLLYTGQRVSDVVRMGRQHVRDGVLTIMQKKGQETVEVSIPICGQLKVVLDEVQSRRIAPTFLLNQFIKARTAAGLSTMFGEWRKKVGLPRDLHAHGLRKTFSAIAAEAGCTPHELMALTGHKTLSEVTRYTVAADRKRLAVEGMRKI